MAGKYHPAIASVVAEHYERSEEFQRSQAEALADILQRVIDTIGLEPGVNGSDSAIFRGLYSIDRLFDRLSAMRLD